MKIRSINSYADFGINRVIRSISVGFLISLAAILSLNANTILVPTDYLFIQDAITASQNGDTILCAPGVYQENIGFSGRDIVVGSLFLTTGDTTYIGLTIIDGGGQSTNYSTVNFLSGETNAALLSGFTIRNGWASGTHAGGITVQNASPTIEDCRIVDNNGDPGMFEGIGIVSRGASPIFRRCLIQNNLAPNNGGYPHNGGGIFVSGGAPYFIDCQIRYNRIMSHPFEANHGGALYAGNTEAVFFNCLFEGNSADHGGAVYLNGGNSSQTIAFHQCTFRDNIVKWNGAAIHMQYLFEQQLWVEDCLLYGNDALQGGWTIWGDFTNYTGATVVINQMTMVDNLTGGLSVIEAAQTAVSNSIIYFNRGPEVSFGMFLNQFTYSDISGIGGGNGNIEQDPVFCDASLKDYQLAANSPCLTGGANGVRIGALDQGCSAQPPQVRRVPQDYATIQHAILTAHAKDTVLVAPGSYQENIDFKGKEIVLASQFLTSGDTAFISQTVIDAGGQLESRPGVWFRTQESRNSKLVGLTITNHYSFGDLENGAIRVEDISWPTIEDCRIIDNTGAPEYFAGIGAYISNSEPIFRRCLFKNNSASFNANNDHLGGAVYVSADYQPRFESCWFINNQLAAQLYNDRALGGAVYSTGSVLLDTCHFENNNAGNGGAFAAKDGIIQIWNSVIRNNHSVFNGGAMATYGAGGQIDVYHDVVDGNSAGVHGGALYQQSDGQSWFNQSTVTNNLASQGGAIFRGGGSAKSVIWNSIIYFNWPQEIGPDTSVVRFDLQTNDVRGFSGAHVFDADPLFIDWAAGDYRIAPNSPCAAAGPNGMIIGALGISGQGIYPQTRQVPQQFASITEAIRHSYQGDTVMVASGTYPENVDFWGRRVLLASNYILSGDTSDISATVIDGGGQPVNQSAVTFWRNEDSLSTMSGLTIANGYAEGTHPGGINIYNAAAPVISDCRIENNIGSGNYLEGIGVRIAQASPTFRRCLIRNNNVQANFNNDHRGGGVIIFGGAPKFRNCDILDNNLAQSIYYRDHGGGAYLIGTEASFRYCRFSGNSAEFGGGIRIDSSPNVDFRNNLILNNHSRANGGGMVIFGDNSAIINNTFWGNQTAGTGGAIYAETADPLLLNNILWANTALNGDDELAANSAAPVVQYTDIQGGWSGTGNIDSDPLFADSLNFYLDPLSPCVDAGHPDAAYNDPEDPNNPGNALFPSQRGLRNDMGAYGGMQASSWIITGIRGDDNLTADADIPQKFTLAQNYPNPFNPTTRIRFALPQTAKVRIDIFNTLGQRVTTLVNGNYPAGYHEVEFNAQGLASGMYFYRFEAGGFVQIRRMMLLK